MDEAQVSQAIQTARDLVSKSNVDPDSPLGVAAFQVILGRFLPERSDLIEPGGGTTLEVVPQEQTATSGVARWADVSEEGLHDMFEFGSNGVEIQIPARVLPASKAARQRLLTLMKLAIDRVAFKKEDVTGAEINDLCDRYACLDQNLPNNLRNYENYISRRGGRGSYSYRVTQPGLAAAKQIIRGLFNAD